jgi:bla regulator protein BlaR1
MNLTTSWMQSEWTKALGWTFVHSLWQIALIGLLLFVVLRLIPGRSAHTRYTISTLALWLIVVMALGTFIVMLPDARNITEITGRLVLVGTTEPVSLADKISAWLEVRMPMMLTIWSGGVTILMVRLAISLGWVRHMRNTTMPETQIQDVLDQIIARLRLKVNPKAGESALVNSPVTIGHLKPLILFPVGILNQLSPKEVEAILTHELAHIVRRDYLSNLVQSFIETLFYYHPITWWISGVVRSERENRADDLAVRWCGDHLGYAKALMKVQEMQTRQAPALAVGFASRKGAMLARIQRILNLPYKNHNQMEKTVLLSLTTLCFLAFTLTSHTTIDSKAELVPPAPLSKIAHVAFLDESKQDSIPTKGTFRIHKKTDDQDINIEMEDGDIKELTIDGKEIQPSEYEAYSEVIEDLFGGIVAPIAMEGFQFTMPAIPSIPAMPMMPEMPYMIEGFEMPEMPEMPEINMEHLFADHINWYGDVPEINIWNGEGMENMRILTDSTPDGNTRIIIISDGDSSVISAQHFNFSGDMPASITIDGHIMNDDEMKSWAEAMELNAESMGKEWRAHADQWRAQQQEWREQSREHANQWRAEQDRMRQELRHLESGKAEDLRALERELSMLEQPQPFVYGFKYPSVSLSDQMVRDGLVAPGDEVEVQLTPDKLKINGEKMPDSIHQKYLRLYEQQQGIELSGNSKVEFKTMSKQRM